MKSEPKKIGIIIRQAPYGSLLPQEAIEATLAAGMYGQKVSLIFMGDAVFQLVGGQDAAVIEQKTMSKQLAALDLYDIEQLYVCMESLLQRQLVSENLVVNVSVLDGEALRSILHEQEILLSF